MKSPIVPLLLGLAFIAGAIAINAQLRATQRADVRDIDALRVELDSVRSALSRTTAGPEAVRLAESVSSRTAILGRREFHVPSRQASIDGWWSLTGVGTVLSAVGALFLLLAVVSGRGARGLHAVRE